MPDLTSVKRLSRFYEDDKIYKINQRIDHFKKIKSLWESRPDE